MFNSTNNIAVKEPMSRRTLHRVLDECSASVRKSFQGLDNFSSQGAEAFDDLDKVVDKLVDCGKTEVWAREMKQQLRSSKQYLKSDYKVFDLFHYTVCYEVLQKKGAKLTES